MTVAATAMPATGHRRRLALPGAGPTGLEATLAAGQRGWDVVVFEQASHVAAPVPLWGHVRLFTPGSLNLSARQQAICAEPAGACPTGHEYAAHLERVAALLPDVRLSTRLEQIGQDRLLKSEEIASERRCDSPFRLLVTGVVEAMRRAGALVGVTLRDALGGTRVVEVDRVVSMTGSVRDARLYRQLQVHECHATEGPITLGQLALRGGRRLPGSDVSRSRHVG